MASVRKRSWTTPRGEPRAAWIVDFVHTNGNRDRRLFKTKRDADTFRIKVEGQLTAGMFRPDAAKTSVAGAAADFLVYCEGRMARGERMTRHNLAGYRGHVNKHVLN